MTTKTSFKIRYVETDQMCFAHHSNYAKYFEAARLDLLNAMDISYRSMEENGIIMPVYSLSTRFYKPALFDDTITITTTIAGKTGVKVTFKYEVFNQHNEKLTDGETVLVFADGKSKRPIKTPKFFEEKYAAIFNKSE